MFFKFFCIFSGVTSGLFIGIYLREKGFSSSVRNSLMAFSGLENQKHKPYIKGSIDNLFTYFSEEKTKDIDLETLFKEQFEKTKGNRSKINSKL